MASYKQLWMLLRTSECAADVRRLMQVPPSKLDRMFESKRLWKLVEQDRRMMEVITQYHASYYVGKLMLSLGNMPSTSPELRKACMDVIRLSLRPVQCSNPPPVSGIGKRPKDSDMPAVPTLRGGMPGTSRTSDCPRPVRSSW